MLLHLLIRVVAKCMGEKAQRQPLKDFLEHRLSKTSDKEWLDKLLIEYGNPTALKPLIVISGLSDCPTAGFVERMLGKGIATELVVAEKCILFCVPTFEVTSEITAIPRSQIKRVGVDFLTGQVLQIDTGNSTIHCQMGNDLEAMTLAAVIRGE